MIHLTKSKTGFMVVVTAKNGEPLSTSEVLKSKQAAWKNIHSFLSLVLHKGYTFVQDETKKDTVVYTADEFNHKEWALGEAVPRYTPSLNKAKTVKK